MTTQPSDTQAIEPMFYRMKHLTKVIGIGKSKIYQMIKDGEFPRPIQISKGALGWRPKDIQAWADALEQQSSK